jgi:hypothetical protein
MLPSDKKNAVLRLFLINWTLGVGLGIVFASLLLFFDIAGLRSLIGRSDLYIQAIALLYGGFAVTFGSVVCGSAIMRLPREDEGPGQPGAAAPADLVPVMVRARRS